MLRGSCAKGYISCEGKQGRPYAGWISARRVYAVRQHHGAIVA